VFNFLEISFISFIENVSKLLLLQVEMKLAELKQQFDEKLAQKEELRKKSEHMELMLDRASQLVSGLTGEKERWENTVKVNYY
jgi:dynein heavy chain, axonemal